jgi:hypothetical protein
MHITPFENKLKPGARSKTAIPLPKKMNDVATKNNTIEAGTIQIDTLIELFHKKVLHMRTLS